MRHKHTCTPPRGGIYTWRVESLVKWALNAKNRDAAWRYVMALHWRGNREVLEAATALCQSQSATERAIGADILGQLGVPERAFPAEVLDILRTMLRGEQDPDVLSSVLVAIGHTQASDDLTGLELIIEKRSHAHEDVRFGVVFALAGRDDRESISALIELSRDPDDDVRDWATFALGTQIDVDNEAIREALRNRTTDSHQDTKCEAILGLARRYDKSVPAVLQEELENEAPSSMLFEAAGAYGDPVFLPRLRAIRQKTIVEEDVNAHWLNQLDEAIEVLERQ